MIVNKITGKLENTDKKIDKVTLEWFELEKKDSEKLPKTELKSEFALMRLLRTEIYFLKMKLP